MPSQCWLLMQVGFNLRQLLETVQDCMCASTTAEQQHGRLAALKRAQAEYHEGTLVARAQGAGDQTAVADADGGRTIACAGIEEGGATRSEQARLGQWSPGVFRSAGAPRERQT